MGQPPEEVQFDFLDGSNDHREVISFPDVASQACEVVVLPEKASPPDISTKGTIIPRHLAATFDNLFAMILGALAAKNLFADRAITQSICFVLIYLGYYFVFEAFMSRTPAKMIAGLMILRVNGTRISFREAAIRTGFRLLEVNPLLLGAIPAALSIIFSRRNQRWGDRAAGTIVIRLF